jgi:Flp pilus assembly protein TadD
VTVGEAMSIAIQCQKNGHLSAAEDIYRAILEQVPDQADAMHYSGVIAHQQGRHEEALALIEASIALAPNQADWHSNLGIVLKARARLDEAVAAFQQAIALDPGHVNAYNNLGVLLRAQGRPAESERPIERRSSSNPITRMCTRTWESCSTASAGWRKPSPVSARSSRSTRRTRRRCDCWRWRTA